MKIKFLDNPQEIIEVTTSQQLHNTKFFCKSRSEIKAIEDLGFAFCTQEDIYFKGSTDYTISLWFDLEYSYGHGYDEERKPFREFEFISPETETDLSSQVETIKGVQAFIQTFDKVNPEPITVEALGAEARNPETLWEIGSSHATYDYKAGGIVAVETMGGKVKIFIQAEGEPARYLEAKGVNTMPELRALEIFVNGPKTLNS